MRINDWSSDVCSSDLEAILYVELLFFIRAKERGEKLGGDACERCRSATEPRPGGRRGDAAGEQARHLTSAAVDQTEYGLVTRLARALEKPHRIGIEFLADLIDRAPRNARILEFVLGFLPYLAAAPVDAIRSEEHLVGKTGVKTG